MGAIIAAAIFLAAALLAVWMIWGNRTFRVHRYVVSGERVPPEFDGFRIAQISDLHDACFGEENSALLEKLARCRPDIIAVTGDFVDSRRTDFDASLRFAREAAHLAPIYYVAGNHESRLDGYEAFQKELLGLGVNVLRDAKTELVRGKDTVVLAGIFDPNFSQPHDAPAECTEKTVRGKLAALLSDETRYTVLLSHRPELFRVYADFHADLVLCGHAHGGQVRLPLVGGLYAPHQGLFPRYDAGRYIKGETNMVVSRGLGNSGFPIRFANRPELVVIELAAEKGT